MVLWPPGEIGKRCASAWASYKKNIKDFSEYSEGGKETLRLKYIAWFFIANVINFDFSKKEKMLSKYAPMHLDSWERVRDYVEEFIEQLQRVNSKLWEDMHKILIVAPKRKKKVKSIRGTHPTMNKIDKEESPFDYPPTYLDTEDGVYRPPDSDPVPAPGKKLDWEEWARTFQRFSVRDKDGKIHSKPAEISSLEKRLHEIIDKYDRVMILVFRGARKSTVGQRYVIRKILDKGVTAAYGSASTTMVEDFSILIRNELMHNRRILEWYGCIIDPQRKITQHKMYWATRDTSDREPGLTIFTPLGKNRLGSHPDIIVLDDVQTLDMVLSKSTLERLKRWFDQEILPMLSTGSKIIYIGTPKGPDDLTTHIAKKGLFKVIRIPAIIEWPNDGQREPGDGSDPNAWYYVKDEDGLVCGVANLRGGKVGFNEYGMENWDKKGRIKYYIDDDPKKGIDKERMALQEFLLKRQEVGPTIFEYEYQLNPVPVERGFLKWDNIQWFGMGDIEDIKFTLFLDLVMFMDQSFGTSNKADYNVIGVMGFYMGNYYLLYLDAWRGGGATEKAKRLQKVYDEFRKEQPENGAITCYIEADLQQAQDVNYLMEKCPEIPIEKYYQRSTVGSAKDGLVEERVVYKLPDNIPASKRAKVIRILNQLDLPIQTGRLYIYKNIKARNLLEQERAFPYAPHFDLLDTIGTLVSICNKRLGVDWGYVGGW